MMTLEEKYEKVKGALYRVLGATEEKDLRNMRLVLLSFLENAVYVEEKESIETSLFAVDTMLDVIKDEQACNS